MPPSGPAPALGHHAPTLRAITTAAGLATSLIHPAAVHSPGHKNKHHLPDHSPLQLALDFASVASLVLLGGVFAGLTLGLMGLDMVNLRVLSTSGTESQQKEARVVLQLLERRRHWVLVVLLLGNVIVNEALPVFLSDFGGGLSAVLTSTLLIVIFGEIVPQAICARYGLSIGAYCAPLVHALMILLAPVAWPTAKLLDWCLGEEQGTVYRKAELKAFVSLHQAVGTEALTEDEVSIIRAVLDLNEKRVVDIMTTFEDVFTLSSDAVLDQKGIDTLVKLGYSRIPVHEPGKPDAVLGMLLVKNLISYDPDDAEPVSSFHLAPLPEAPPGLTLFDCLNYFQHGRSHMLLVSDYPGEPRGARGIVTLEDVIEELIGREIEDEFDEHNDRGGGQWEPLLRGIIERRWKHVPSLYGLPIMPKRKRSASGARGGTYGSLDTCAPRPIRHEADPAAPAVPPPETVYSPSGSISTLKTRSLTNTPQFHGTQSTPKLGTPKGTPKWTPRFRLPDPWQRGTPRSTSVRAPASAGSGDVSAGLAFDLGAPNLPLQLATKPAERSGVSKAVDTKTPTAWTPSSILGKGLRLGSRPLVPSREGDIKTGPYINHVKTGSGSLADRAPFNLQSAVVDAPREGQGVA